MFYRRRRRPFFLYTLARLFETMARQHRRESPGKPVDSESDRRDYEKLLSYYDRNIAALEKGIVSHERYEHVYGVKPELQARWKETYDGLQRNLDWADRNMDYLESRGRDKNSRRLNLASRRSELSS